MDRDWLEAQLAAGRSIESIAREVGKHPSTVGYWVKKHGLALAARRRARRTRRRSAARRSLELVERGMSIRQIGEEAGLSYAARPVLAATYGLKTRAAAHDSRREADEPRVDPPRVRAARLDRRSSASGARGCYRCPQCRDRSGVAAYRRRVKELLIEEAGGVLRALRIRPLPGALQFHHLDPAQKSFARHAAGLTGRWRQHARRGAEMRALVRELPRGGRGGARYIRPLPSRYIAGLSIGPG